jgi:hypothetical protein
MELVASNFYVNQVLLMPHAKCPKPVNPAFAPLNNKACVPMQAPSEMGATGGWLIVDSAQKEG